MSITLDVNAFLNKDVCTQSGYKDGTTTNHDGGDVILLEKEMEMETNIFDEIEHLLKFNKNLEFPNEPAKGEDKKIKPKKPEDNKPKAESFNLDFLSHTDDFLLASETQSLLGEDSLLYSVEHDRLQPLTSKFMVPGIYKRIEGIATQDHHKKPQTKLNVFTTDLEKSGRILTEKEFERVYDIGENAAHNPVRKIDFMPLIDPTTINSDHLHDTLDKVQHNIQEVEREPLQEWDSLNRLACDILKLARRDHIVIDRKNNEIVRTHHRTNQKTIYRFCQPEGFGLKMHDYKDSESSSADDDKYQEKRKSKLGRPRKRLKNDEEILKISPKVTKQEITAKPSEDKQEVTIKPIPHARTRSGRLIRKPMLLQPQLQEPQAETEDSIKNLLNDLKDVSYHNSKVDMLAKDRPEPPKTPPPVITSCELMSANEQSPTTSSPKRKVPPEAICPTCNKIFLGKRLQRHFAQHPEHMKIPRVEKTMANSNHDLEPQSTLIDSSSSCGSEEVTLFQFLVNKLQRSQQLNEDQKADLFLSELNDLVEQLQLRSSRLIRNTSGLHFVNQRCSKLLSIPEGQYALDLTAIESPVEPDMHDNANNQILNSSSTSLPAHINTRSLDYTNLSITLDDTLTDEAAQKLNLSAGGKLLPPSEESLLRAVDDLVQTNITKIQSTAVCASDTSLNSSKTNTTSVVANILPPHIDHVSDNAVEAVNMKETSSSVVSASENPLLDLSVDFFQFNN
ncbi:uncharacterized protein LOC106086072 [Stomoxys calcitrans]|uniref:uncharacterized protein LOC106086072 n=1 Tax=Stomoxys calcitrans TaxID=35570 RepID=UPI0027E221F4|nr:uncharacterized protein LOC106086072 [Stomoxys calcitrans]